MTVLEIIGSIVTIMAGTAGIMGGILSAFFKTNKKAEEDYKELRKAYDRKIENLKQELKSEFQHDSTELKEQLQIIGNKIDEMKIHYVTNENFKTYAETMNQFLKLNSDRMERIESTLDGIREDITSIIRSVNQK